MRALCRKRWKGSITAEKPTENRMRLGCVMRGGQMSRVALPISINGKHIEVGAAEIHRDSIDRWAETFSKI